jgi:cytochrome c oxidase assembly protein subunit 15
MRNAFPKFAWGVLGYNFLVILWGAWVRISGSGAGCGEHWPSCNGEVIPNAPSYATFIEFTHRLTSGLSLVLTVLLLIGAYLYYPKQSLTRKNALAAMGFLLSEAGLGAALVIFSLVNKNDSVARAVVITLHLVNTMALIAFGAITAWSSNKKQASVDLQKPELLWLWVALAGVLFTCMAGAVTALGDTLFPVDLYDSRDLLTRLGEDVSTASHFLIRLRALHPIVAVCAGLILLWVCARWRDDDTDNPRASVFAWLVSGLVLAQMLAGILNIALAAPGWMQLIHLLLADTLWVSLILLIVEVASSEPARKMLHEHN